MDNSNPLGRLRAMTEPQAIFDSYSRAVSARIDAILAGDPPFALHPQSQNFADFIAPARALSVGGKRSRARFFLAGFQAGSGLTLDQIETLVGAVTNNSLADALVGAGAALELYQLSALVHDDIIDAAATRRGVPTAHTTYAKRHAAAHWLGDAREYGDKIGILLGDYLLSLAAYTWEIALAHCSEIEAHAATNARLLFHSMTGEVAFGQFTDAHNEFLPLLTPSPATEDPEQSADPGIANALSVLYHKAARYSVTVPTELGAELGCGFHGDGELLASRQESRTETLAQLEAITRPVGEAFQLRDDTIGVFGLESATGKPAGGDIIEGKRTALLALTRQRANGEELALIDSLLGKQITAEQLESFQGLIRSTGAYDAHETMITTRENAARELISGSDLQLDLLRTIVEQLAGRWS